MEKETKEEDDAPPRKSSLPHDEKEEGGIEEGIEGDIEEVFEERFDIQKRRVKMLRDVKYYARFQEPLKRGRIRARRSDPDRKRPGSFYKVQPSSWLDVHEPWLGRGQGLATRECWGCHETYQVQRPWSNKERHCTPCYYNLFIQESGLRPS